VAGFVTKISLNQAAAVEVRVQITVAILPVRGEAGSAVAPTLGAPIIRKPGKVTGTPPRTALNNPSALGGAFAGIVFDHLG
jgi:hypothetical protein